MRKLTPCGVIRISSDGDESKDFLGFEISDCGIFGGIAGRPRDFWGFFFFLPHSIIPFTSNLEYPFGELTVLPETFDAKKPCS